MKRVLKRMTGMLLSAVLLVSMGMTVSAVGEVPADWSVYMKWLYEGAESSPEQKAQLMNDLEKYLAGTYVGDWLDMETNEPFSKEDARILYERLKNSNSSNTSAKKEEHVKTTDEKIQDEAVREIDKALQSGSATAVFDGRYYGINTLSRDLMGEINRRGVSMVFKYTYSGYNYEITIPAGQAPVNPDVPWCGPMYLYVLFADTAVVTPIA